jgi:hypothetical protein
MKEVQATFALASQRDRFGVDEEIGDEASPVFAENATDFGEVIPHGIGEKMSKNGRKEDEIEGVIVVRKAIILGTVFAERVEKLVVQVSDFKAEIGKTRGDVPDTPIDAVGAGVEAVIFALGRQIMGKRQGHSSNTTPNVKHLVVRLQLPILDEIAKILFSDGLQVAVAPA